MSKAIEQVKFPHGGQPSVADQNILATLPMQCATPGYWSSLAANASSWAREVSVGPLWQSANTELEGWRREFQREFGGVLNIGTLPNFVGKSEARIKEKTLEKIQRAEAIASGVKQIFDQPVPVPRLEDLVRVRLQVQFLDGVPFLAKKIHELVLKDDPNATIEPKGSLNGYFAQHLTFRSQVYFRFGAAPEACNVTCEIQIATSLATHVWENSHGLYENTRMTLERSEDWQWSPKDPRFLSRQLGHMIHLADGLFCNLRDSNKATNN